MPGVGGVLLQECVDQLQAGRSWCQMEYHRLENEAKGRVKVPQTELAAQLIEDVVLAVSVSRTNRVVRSSDWTYQDLETSGLIVLSSSIEPRVHLIRPVFDRLLECALDNDQQSKGLYMLQQALNIFPSDPSMSLWQQFEIGRAHV